MKRLLFVSAFFICSYADAQMNITGAANKIMTPEMLWSLGRVSATGLSKDKKNVIFTVSIPSVEENKSKRRQYIIPVVGGDAKEITSTDDLLVNDKISPDGKYIISSNSVSIKKVKGSDLYTDLPKSNAYVFTSLN